MKPQIVHDAISAAAVVELCSCEEDTKGDIRDMMMCAGQVGTALSLCWMVHLFV